MTETRGRALLISNEYKLPDGSYRNGSEHDYRNMRALMVKLGFVVAGGHQNYTAKGIVEAIHKETQLVDETGEFVYKNLGVFVLVITSHGAENCVAGVDGKLVKLTDIYNLLSPRNFPAMQGKPKLIIIQACAGGRREMLLDSANQSLPSPENAAAPQPITTLEPRIVEVRRRGSEVTDELFQLDSLNKKISIADLLIMQSSFDTFASLRSAATGSPFIRALVVTFYKFAGKYDVATLAEMIREAVTENVPQMPKTVSTLTDMRKLYLRPGVNMRRAGEHPQSLTDPRYPDGNTDTTLEWLPDRMADEDMNNPQSRTYTYIIWNILKRRRVPATPAAPATPATPATPAALATPAATATPAAPATPAAQAP